MMKQWNQMMEMMGQMGKLVLLRFLSPHTVALKLTLQRFIGNMSGSGEMNAEQMQQMMMMMGGGQPQGGAPPPPDYWFFFLDKAT